MKQKLPLEKTVGGLTGSVTYQLELVCLGCGGGLSLDFGALDAPALRRVERMIRCFEDRLTELCFWVKHRTIDYPDGEE